MVASLGPCHIFGLSCLSCLLFTDLSVHLYEVTTIVLQALMGTKQCALDKSYVIAMMDNSHYLGEENGTVLGDERPGLVTFGIRYQGCTQQN